MAKCTKCDKAIEQDQNMFCSDCRKVFCPICFGSINSTRQPLTADQYWVDCVNCGEFRIYGPSIKIAEQKGPWSDLSGRLAAKELSYVNDIVLGAD